MARVHQFIMLAGAATVAMTVAGCARYEHHDGGHQGKADDGRAIEEIWVYSILGNSCTLDS